jgi:hypothetical protein
MQACGTYCDTFDKKISVRYKYQQFFERPAIESQA